MYAIIQSGGKQYRVAPGNEVKVEKMPGAAGEAVTFDKVLLAGEEDQIRVGQPYLAECRVVGRIIRQAKDRKVIVFKYKRRKGYRRTRGHRQAFTLVQIENIEAPA